MKRTGESENAITVGDVSIPVVINEIPIGELRYYRSNPRIFRILKQLGSKVSQEVIERELWALDSTKDLFRDIQNNGGLVDEILVRDQEVLEGNSRLCAYRHLFRRAREKGDEPGIAKWSKIRAKLLPSDVDDQTVFGILGILHIRGKAKWLPFEQASYLHRQSVDYRKSYKELGEQIGLGEGVVRAHIEAYAMMEEKKVKDVSKFSYFLEYVKSKKLKEAAEFLPPGRQLPDVFVELVENGDIPKGENVRHLPLILKCKKARTKFLGRTASFEEALAVAKDRHPEATSSFYSKLKRATEAMEDAEVIRVKDDIATDTEKKYILKNLMRTVKKFCKAVGLEPETASGR